MNILAAIETISRRYGLTVIQAEIALIRLVQQRIVRSTGCSTYWGNQRRDIWDCWLPRIHPAFRTTYDHQANSIENIVCGKVTDVEINDDDLGYQFELWLPAETAATPSPTAETAPRPRGPTPKVKPRLLEEMSKLSSDSLAAMKLAEMQETFKASARFVAEARKTVLDQRGYKSLQETLAINRQL
jgi:hypothetical protein